MIKFVTKHTLGAVLALGYCVAAAQPIDDSWTSELPPVQDIIDYYSDGDELDVAARRFVALETIHKGVQLKVGRRLNTNGWTTREKAALDRYREARKAVNEEISDKYRESDNERYQDYLQRRFDVRSDAANQNDIVQRFAPVLSSVLMPYIAEQTSQRSALAKRRVNRSVTSILQLVFGASISLIFVYLLVGSWRDKKVENSVMKEERDGHTILTYLPGKHGPVAALSIYPLYINVVLFLLTLSVGLIFLFVALENNEAFNAFMEKYTPDFMVIIIYPEVWIAIGLILLFAPWWFLAIANFRRRKPRKIAVSSAGIAVGSKTYLLENLRKFYVWGDGDGSSEENSGGSSFIVGGGNAAASAAAAGAMHSAAIQDSANLFQRKLGRVSNVVIGEFGEQKYVLAKWLPLRRAMILADEIENAIARHQQDA